MEGTYRSGQVSLKITSLEIESGLCIDELTINASSLTIGTKPFSWRLDNPAPMQIRIGEASLRTMILAKAPPQVQDVTVKLEDDRVWITSKIKMLLTVQGSVELALRIEDQSKIFVELISMDAVASAAKSMIEAQLAKMNPIIDIGDFPIKLQILKSAIADGFVVIDSLVVAND